VSRSGREIAGCVAFVSLQLRREDYKVTVATTGESRYVLPPSTTAEEALAHYWGVPLMVRLKDAALEKQDDAGVRTFEFGARKKFEYVVSDVIAELKRFREKRDFPELMADARARHFEALRRA
jgi:hypothetical protein